MRESPDRPARPGRRRAPAGWPTRRWCARSPRSTSTPRPRRARRLDRVRFCATSATRDSSNADVFARGRARRGSASGPRCCRATRRPRWRTTVRSATCGPPPELARAGRRHRRRVDRADPRRRIRAERGAVDGHGLGADARAVPDRRPADRRRGRRLRGRHRRPPRRLPGARGRGGHRGRRSPARSLSITAGVLDLPTYDKSVIDQSVLAGADVHAFVDRLVAMPVARTARVSAGCTRAGRRARRRRADPEPGAAPSRPRRVVVSEADILDGIAWSMV